MRARSVSELRPASKRISPGRLTDWVKNMGPKRREHLAASGAVFLFTIILFSPLLSGRTFSMVGAHMYAQYPWTALVKNNPDVEGRGYPQTDDPETFYPNNVFTTNAIRSGQLPLWLPYSFGGIPLTELGLTSTLYPPRLLMALFLDPIQQRSFLLFTHLLLAGLGMYALLRCWGANMAGAIFGAIVWELNGHNAFWLVVEHIAIAAAWLPLMLLAATLAVRRQSLKWAIAAGAAMGVALFSASLHYVYLSALVLMPWYATLTALAVRKLLLEGKRRAAFFCLSLPVTSVVVAAAVSAAYWMPLTQWLSSVHRAPVSLTAQLSEALPFSRFIQVLVWPENAASPAGKGPDMACFAFTGILALILSLPALLRRSAPVFFAAILCALSLGFALGFSPLIKALRIIPYFVTVHPHSGFFLFAFAVGVLAAFGISEAGHRLGRVRRARHLLAVAGCLLLVAQAWQLIAFARAINPVQPERAEWLFPETPMISALRNLQGDYHVLPVSFRDPKGKWTPPVLTGKITAVFGLRSGSGYESLLPVYVAGLWRTVEQGGSLASNIPPAFKPYFYHDRLSFSLLEKISVGLLAVPPGVKPVDNSGRDPVSDGSLELVYQGGDGWIYRLTRAVPRAFLVPQVLSVSDGPASLRMLVDQSMNPREVAIVTGEQPTLSGDSQSVGFEASASIVSDLLNEVVVEAATPRAAMLVLNDSWAPGWKAYVDEIEHPVLRVNYAFRGVVVSEGKHRVVFLYRPPLLMIGLAVSSSTLLLIVILYVGIGVHAIYRRLTQPSS